MATYEAPTITELGTVQDLTLETINKSAGSGDVIVITGQEPDQVPGGSVTSVS
jgi:hypothetical protein